ncbi:hypothetical protein C8R44DRAFT_782523 [Mycena epipterygia]|nr:hypothetical protein C8R44DRAFT_782523 [Mycena epipterygia]
MSLPGLPADLQYELLSYLPDFSALNSLILTSRSFHAVFRAHRDLVLKTVAENFLGITLGEEIIGDSATLDHETDDSKISGTIKFLVGTRAAIEALEPIVFRLLVHQDAHWDEPNRCPSVSESTRIRRAAYRFATFCALPSEQRQSRLLSQLTTIEVFELVHFVDGLRKMVYVLDGDDRRQDDSDDGRVSRIVSTGPATIWRLWNLRPGQTEEGESSRLAAFHEIMTTAEAGTDDGAFDDALHHFEVSRNVSAFDSTRARALLDVGHQETEEALLQLECLMEAPSPPPKPKRPRFRSLKLPLCDNSNKKSTRLSFLPDDLNDLNIRYEIPYSVLVLNGEPRIMPLNARQLAELVNNIHL